MEILFGRKDVLFSLVGSIIYGYGWGYRGKIDVR